VFCAASTWANDYIFDVWSDGKRYIFAIGNHDAVKNKDAQQRADKLKWAKNLHAFMSILEPCPDFLPGEIIPPHALAGLTFYCDLNEIHYENVEFRYDKWLSLYQGSVPATEALGKVADIMNEIRQYNDGPELAEIYQNGLNAQNLILRRCDTLLNGLKKPNRSIKSLLTDANYSNEIDAIIDCASEELANLTREQKKIRAVDLYDRDLIHLRHFHGLFSNNHKYAIVATAGYFVKTMREGFRKLGFKRIFTKGRDLKYNTGEKEPVAINVNEAFEDFSKAHPDALPKSLDTLPESALLIPFCVPKSAAISHKPWYSIFKDKYVLGGFALGFGLTFLAAYIYMPELSKKFGFSSHDNAISPQGSSSAIESPITMAQTLAASRLKSIESTNFNGAS
jgi:hypothetical protein